MLAEINLVISVVDKPFRENLDTKNSSPRKKHKKEYPNEEALTQRKEIFLMIGCRSKMDSYPKFGLDVKPDDATHTQRGYEKVHYVHNEIFQGE